MIVKLLKYRPLVYYGSNATKIFRNIRPRPRYPIQPPTTQKTQLEVHYDVSLEEGSYNNGVGHGAEYEDGHPALRKYGTFSNNYGNGNNDNRR